MRFVVAKVWENDDSDPFTAHGIPKVETATLSEARMMADKFTNKDKGWVGIILDKRTGELVE